MMSGRGDSSRQTPRAREIRENQQGRRSESNNNNNDALRSRQAYGATSHLQRGGDRTGHLDSGNLDPERAARLEASLQDFQRASFLAPTTRGAIEHREANQISSRQSYKDRIIQALRLQARSPLQRELRQRQAEASTASRDFARATQQVDAHPDDPIARSEEIVQYQQHRIASDIASLTQDLRYVQKQIIDSGDHLRAHKFREQEHDIRLELWRLNKQMRSFRAADIITEYQSVHDQSSIHDPNHQEGTYIAMMRDMSLSLQGRQEDIRDEYGRTSGPLADQRRATVNAMITAMEARLDRQRR
jgi:hypothetical protein